VAEVIEKFEWAGKARILSKGVTNEGITSEKRRLMK
jgi:hypothetical protein